MGDRSDVAAKRPKAVMLDTLKHPLPKRIYTLFGVNVLFAYSIVHLCLLSFTFMYLNVYTAFRFGVFSTLMTGNLVDATTDIPTSPSDTAFKITLIFASTGMGTFLSGCLLTSLNSRENAMAVMLAALVLSCFLLDWLDDLTDSRFVLCVLATTSGAMVHWSKSLGYVCSAMTGNMFKLSEFLFKAAAGYDVGGPKAVGDFIIILCIEISAMIGGLCALGMLIASQNMEYVVFTPIFASVPFHLYLSGCFYKWG